MTIKSLHTRASRIFCPMLPGQIKARLAGIENFLCGAFVRHKKDVVCCIFYVYRVHAHVMNLSGICAPELGRIWLDKTPECPATGRPGPTYKS